jgi:hypothetical protein
VIHNEQRLEEQAIAKAAEMQLSSRLDTAEKIDVDIHTDLLKVVLGHADSVEIAGQGLVLQKDIRVQEMKVQTDSVDINPLSILFGEVELNKPIDANIKIVVTQADLNRALNSDYILSQAKNLKLNVDGQTVTLDMQQMELRLPDGEEMLFSGNSLIHESGNTQPMSFTAKCRPRTSKHPVLLEEFQCNEGHSISLDVTVALMHKIKELTNLPYFNLQGMRLCIQEMEVQTGRIILQIQAHIVQIPS